MKTIKFIIIKGNIHDKVFATNAYTARAREAMGIPTGIIERMQLSADDKHIIDPMIDSSVNEITSEIVRYHPRSSVEFTENENGVNYEFNVAVPVNYPTGNADRLAMSVESYIANRTLQNWYTDIKPDEASISAAKAQNDVMTIHTMLTQRTRPIKSTENA